jgi:hemoglobin-like flavoprotein
MNETTITRLRDSYDILAHRLEELANRFYAALFSENPGIRPLFPARLTGPKRNLIATVSFLVNNLHTPEVLSQPLLGTGPRYQDRPVPEEYYPIFRDTLIDVMEDMSGASWNQQRSQDWREALDLASVTILELNREARALYTM